MLIDDAYLCSLANINDRSLLGARDSEIACLVEDAKRVQSTMSGKPYEARAFAISLRLRLFQEQLGIDEPDRLRDPVVDAFFSDVWLHTAKVNTALFREAFHCMPDDSVRSWKEYRAFMAHPPRSPEEIELLVRGVRGFLVNFPTRYMENEDLGAGGKITNLVPSYLFT